MTLQDQIYQLVDPIQTYLLELIQTIEPQLLQLQSKISEHVIQPLQPFYAQVAPFVMPYYYVVLGRLEMMWMYIVPYVLIAQGYLPSLAGYPINYVGIGVIIGHVVLYNLVAQLEYSTRIFTKIFGKLAIWLNVLLLIASALIRDHYLLKILQTDQDSRLLFTPSTAESLATALIVFGVFLNLWVLKVLGVKNMYNGDSFGYLLNKPVEGGPFRWFDDPQYFGTTVAFLGYAVKYQSRIGYGLVGVMYLVFSFSSVLIEGPHMRRVYANRDKKKKDKGRLKKE